MPLHPEAKKMREPLLGLAPEFHSPAVARCCKAWNRTYRAHRIGGTNPVSSLVRANEAYRAAMPPLSSPQNLCDFIACVAHGVTVLTVDILQAAPLLDAARAATRALKLASDEAKPRGKQRKNKIPGCETVDSDSTSVEATTYQEKPLANRPQIDRKSA